MPSSNILGSCLKFLEGTATVLDNFHLLLQEKILEEHAALLPPLLKFSFVKGTLDYN